MVRGEYQYWFRSPSSAAEPLRKAAPPSPAPTPAPAAMLLLLLLGGFVEPDLDMRATQLSTMKLQPIISGWGRFYVAR